MPAPKKSATHPHLRTYIMEVCGKEGLQVADIVGDGATDEKIEKKTQGRLKMAEIRAILNQLHNHGIVDYKREKNMQNGWFTYTWEINTDRAMQSFLSAKKKEWEGLRARALSEEGALFYKCRKGCMKVAFDQAMESEFKCPGCNGKMKHAENGDEMRQLNEKIAALEQILGGSNGNALRRN